MCFVFNLQGFQPITLRGNRAIFEDNDPVTSLIHPDPPEEHLLSSAIIVSSFESIISYHANGKSCHVIPICFVIRPFVCTERRMVADLTIQNWCLRCGGGTFFELLSSARKSTGVDDTDFAPFGPPIVCLKASRGTKRGWHQWRRNREISVN